MGLSLPVLAIIGRLFITRYGALRGSSTPAKRRRFRIALPPILSRIPIRLPGRLPAMIWLELRQSMPLAAFGFLLAVLMSIATVLIERQHGYSFGTSVAHGHAAFHVRRRHVVGRRGRIRPVLGGSRLRPRRFLEIPADIAGPVVLDQVRRWFGGGCGCAGWSHDPHFLEISTSGQ